MSRVKEIIRRQLDHSGIMLLSAAKALSDDEFFWEPPVGGSMASTMRHLSGRQDWAGNRGFNQTEPKLRRGEREAFKGGRAITDSDREMLRDRSVIEGEFANEQYQTIQALDAFDEEGWNVSTPSGCRFPTYGILWEHLATHNHWHLGAISVSHPKLTQLVMVAPRYYTVDPQDNSN
jgi:hypothetical protein